MPRSPPRSFIAIGGARPGVVIFPATGNNQSLSVSAFVSGKGLALRSVLVAVASM